MNLRIELIFICVLSFRMDVFAKEALEAHNKYRTKHHAPAMKWSAQMGKEAQAWADNLARTGQFAHSSNDQRKGDGENIYMSFGRADLNGGEAVDEWYNEIKDYDFNNDRFSGNTGHFTQVVWKGSKELGMAKAKASDGKIFVVGRYRPPGNFMSQFEANISPA
jgi:uncharacterized protein YkwD